MAQFGDFIARLFSGGGSRGLSGDGDLVLPPGPDQGAYNDFLRRYRTEDDLAEDPSWIWSTRGSVLRRRGGLQAHLLSQKSDAVAGFTDVLVILSMADRRRMQIEGYEAWEERATELLRDRFADFCQEEDYHLLFPLRPPGFRFLEDGCPEMGSRPLGLQAGEFITGLLPNLYIGPGEHSRAVIAIHVNLPGRWEGYREVGRLYNDQLQFTLGSHWLDSFHEPALQRPSLYRLQQYADGSLVHVIHPDHQDSYRVTSHTSDAGVSVLTLQDRLGHAVAHLVLSVVEMGEAAPSSGPISLADIGKAPYGGPGIQLPNGQTGTPLALGGHRTVVPLDVDERIFRLRERGALLQKVHFNKFMEGYDVYLTSDGAVETTRRSPAATFQVRGRAVSLVAHRPGVALRGQTLSVGTPYALHGDTQIGIAELTVEYRDLSEIAAEGWPYLGEIRRLGGSASIVFGGVYKIGRDRGVKVRLPDEPDNDNIVWLPGVTDGAMIRSRTGDIPKSRFYTDSIMVASVHAEIDLGAEPTLGSQAKNCFTFVRRGRQIIGLHPVDKGAGPFKTTLRSGDEILVGNCVFEVSYPPADSALPDPFAEEAVFQEAMAPSFSLPNPFTIPPDDLPAAAGLGERGPAPPKPQLPPRADDSFSDEDGQGRGAQLALAGAGPSNFGDVVYDQPKGGPRLVFDQDFHPPARRDPPPREPQTAAPRLPDGVWVVREEDWQLELARPARLLVSGWMVTGNTTISNHRRGAIALPENLSSPDQGFAPVDYFHLTTRGPRGHIERLSHPDASLLVDGEQQDATDHPERARMAVLRRDRKGDPDFEIQLHLRYDPDLPDPRAQLLVLDQGEPMVRGMFTLGLPLKATRGVQLGPIHASVLFDGDLVGLSEYLSSYRNGDSFHPFFVRLGGEPWRTVPEDGQTLALTTGDQLLAGATLYTVQID